VPRAQDAFTPQPIPATSVGSYSAPVDIRSLGVRRGLIPAGLGRVFGNVRQALGPEGRAEARAELGDMTVAALRAFRNVLDYTAELTVELELRLR